MEIVLVDTFVVAADAKAEFLAEVRRSAALLRTLPGFVEGFVYDQIDGASANTVVTTAVWRDEAAFQAAKASAAEAFRQIGFDPPSIMKRLNVEMQRGVYRRSPY